MDIAETYARIVPRYPELKGRVALVTGSSRSIGKAIALRLAREGMKLVLHGLDADELEATVREFEGLGVDTTAVAVDFSEEDSVERLFAQVTAQHDSLEILVNNAASLRRTNIDGATTDMLDLQLAINLRAPYLCSLRALAMMRPAGRGSVVNISSVGGLRAHWRGLPYGMTKSGLDGMTRTMALECARDGVRVNGVAPGAVYGVHMLPDDHPKEQARRERIPMGRVAMPGEIGATVAFLSSDDAKYITGQILYVDGGLTAQLTPPGQPV